MEKSYWKFALGAGMFLAGLAGYFMFSGSSGGASIDNSLADASLGVDQPVLASSTDDELPLPALREPPVSLSPLSPKTSPKNLKKISGDSVTEIASSSPDDTGVMPVADPLPKPIPVYTLGDVSSTATNVATSTPSSLSDPPSPSLISVSIIGGGAGTITSKPAGILCGFTCQASFPAGTQVKFTANLDKKSLFHGWLGACPSNAAGTNPPTCTIIASGTLSVVAYFDPAPVAMPPSVLSSSVPSPSSSPSSSMNTSNTDQIMTGSVNHLVISQIQLSGAVHSNSFVKIFNPTTADVDIGGWKLRKKSSTGTDYSLRSIPKGTTIASGAYFVWANSAGGFADSIGADASSTETLSADNSVGLLDASGNIVDAVAWGTGTNQYVESTAFATNPIANQTLTRRAAGGTVVDSDDNASDFVLQ